MKKAKSLVSALLMMFMLCNMITITASAQISAPKSVKWDDKQGFEIYETLEKGTIIFDLVPGMDIYQFKLYKDGELLYTEITEITTDNPYWCEKFGDIIAKNGNGTYTCLVGVCEETLYDYDDPEEVVPLAATMSDEFVYVDGGSVAPLKATDPIAPATTTTPVNPAPNQPTKTPEISSEGYATVVIDDIYNNPLFEVVGEGDKYYHQHYANAITDLVGYGFLVRGSRSSEYVDGYKVSNETKDYVDSEGNIFPTPESKMRSMIHEYSCGYMLYAPDALRFQSIYTQIYDAQNKILYELPSENPDTPYEISFFDNDGNAQLFKVKRSNYSYDPNFGTHANVDVLEAYTVKLKKYPIVTVTYDGKKIGFDQIPIIENGRTLVPLRAIFETLGATVDWDGATQTVTATKDDTKISLTIDNTLASKNGESITLDVPAKIVNGRTLVPVRFIADCFGVGVDWDAEMQRVILTSNK
ncbi:MAG: copper amine oxidase N-terminal domain-containing protein [Ruminococcaceae bacterium]|nr:copper amine oxidase N-terminal domain-containing protein [Oscillospiraceae bacterium]